MPESSIWFTRRKILTVQISLPQTIKARSDWSTQRVAGFSRRISTFPLFFVVRRSFKTTFEDNSTSHAMYFQCTPLKVDCADDTHER